MTMRLRVRIVELDWRYPSDGGKKAKKIRPGYCKNCGSKLTDELSIKRGFGRECFEKCTAIVFETFDDSQYELAERRMK